MASTTRLKVNLIQFKVDFMRSNNKEENIYSIRVASVTKQLNSGVKYSFTPPKRLFRELALIIKKIVFYFSVSFCN